MKTIGNIIWFLLIGIESALGWWLMGLILCITIIGIPFGKQCFKIGTACLTPVGKIMDTNFDAHPIANILWLIRLGGGSLLSCAGRNLLHHDNRYSLRQAVLQAHENSASSFRSTRQLKNFLRKTAKIAFYGDFFEKLHKIYRHFQ